MTIKELTKILYEATRLEAEWSHRTIVPEVWEKRDEKFRKQMIELIGRYMKMEKLPTPEEAHNSWMESYFKMGWKYGDVRDPVAKLHPDLVPYYDLPLDEREKDAIFLAFVFVAKSILGEKPQKESDGYADMVF